MFQNQLSWLSSFKGSLKGLEVDVQHANTLADAVHKAYGGACLQMKLSYSPMAPIFLFLLQWVNCVPTYVLPSYLGLLQIVIYKVNTDKKSTVSAYERGASIKEFYAIIYPSLKQLESDLLEKEDVGRKRGEEWRKISDKDLERDDECGICLEICTKMVLPSCNHVMCINCYHDWNKRSQSCPFCRGSLKRVRSRDLWVLTSTSDVVDTATLEEENVVDSLSKEFLESCSSSMWIRQAPSSPVSGEAKLASPKSSENLDVKQSGIVQQDLSNLIS